jgi:hypothetical protein
MFSTTEGAFSQEQLIGSLLRNPGFSQLKSWLTKTQKEYRSEIPDRRTARCSSFSDFLRSNVAPCFNNSRVTFKASGLDFLMSPASLPARGTSNSLSKATMISSKVSGEKQRSIISSSSRLNWRKPLVS